LGKGDDPLEPPKGGCELGKGDDSVEPPKGGCELGKGDDPLEPPKGGCELGKGDDPLEPPKGGRVMSEFSWPWALLSLLIIPIVAGIVWLLRRRRRRAAVRVTSIALVRAALPPRTRWTRLIPTLLLLLGFATLGVGAARPQATVPVPSNSTTIMLAMDVSGSMCSTDVEPNRLTVAQEAAVSFIKSQDSNTKIGLVAFAGVAGLQVPPTTDKDALIKAIDNFTTARGTAIGSAILTSIDSIAAINPTVAPTGVDAESAQRSGYAADVIVVLTDGANTQGVEPATAAEAAAVRGLRVFTIGFGTTTPSRMACTGRQASGWAGGGSSGGFSGGGGRNPRVIDEATLQTVADITGGQYYKAESADQLQGALGDLPSKVTVVRKHVDIASWFAGAGGLLVAVAVGLSLWWNRVRAPR
jgi:Ca-activated chloride channel homolog